MLKAPISFLAHIFGSTQRTGRLALQGIGLSQIMWARPYRPADQRMGGGYPSYWNCGFRSAGGRGWPGASLSDPEFAFGILDHSLNSPSFGGKLYDLLTNSSLMAPEVFKRVF